MSNVIDDDILSLSTHLCFIKISTLILVYENKSLLQKVLMKRRKFLRTTSLTHFYYLHVHRFLEESLCCIGADLTLSDYKDMINTVVTQLFRSLHNLQKSNPDSPEIVKRCKILSMTCQFLLSSYK